MDWFEVDRKGLAKLLARKGKQFVLFELIQNAWDENTTTVEVTLERIAGTRSAQLTVRDDNPEGFADLSHAFTLFAESAKKTDAQKRGRFNLGEKLVLAICEEAEIASTRGTVRFDAKGRHAGRKKLDRGSVFTGRLQMTNAELEACVQAVQCLIPPPGIRTLFNGEPLALREPLKVIEASLPTEVADVDGALRSTQRKTRVAFYEPLPEEEPSLYEVGIPVVATGDRWHIDIAQKVPLNFDRDNVTPAYLARVRALAVSALAEHLSTEDANATWVHDALGRHGETLGDETVNRLVELRFGPKRVAYDPSDAEANNLAVAQGYTVVHGGQMSKGEWEHVRRAGALLPAGRVTPSPKPYSEEGKPLALVRPEDWTADMRAVVGYIDRVAPALLGQGVRVRIASDITWPFAATYGVGELTLNLGRLGHRWFAGDLAAINALLLHEFGHHFSGNHLSSQYHDALTTLGARLAELALAQPELFRLER